MTCSECIRLRHRLLELEEKYLVSQSVPPSPPQSSLPPSQVLMRTLDFSKYARRKIALKINYEGWRFHGLSYSHTETPLPTVEGTLLDALVHARLVPSRDLQSIGYSACGRTDRGVSAAEQVVSLWVRSALPAESLPSQVIAGPQDQDHESVYTVAQAVTTESAGPASGELDYDHLLNRLLPASMRVAAWSPVDVNFDARFSCRERRYKYFFSPLSHAPLDFEAMNEAAKRLIGQHDFRNLVKIDVSKQRESYVRSIIAAEVRQDTQSDLWLFELAGNGFMWHQVRHIVAILFMVGAGCEQPTVIDRLLDIDDIASKPHYDIADPLPLVLWRCSYPEKALSWRKSGSWTYQGMVQTCQEHRIRSALSQTFLAAYSTPQTSAHVMLQLGAGRTLAVNKGYRPLLDRARGQTPAQKFQRQSQKRESRLGITHIEATGQSAARPDDVTTLVSP